MKQVLIKGDYVLATKWDDGDPCDPFCVGFFREMLGDRFLVEDGSEHLFRANGYRRCERINVRTGSILTQGMPIIGDKPGRSVWYWAYHPAQLAQLIEQANNTGAQA